MGLLLHDMCVRHASEFIDEELFKGESVFRGLRKQSFLLEMTVLNYWIAGKVVLGGKSAVSELTGSCPSIPEGAIAGEDGAAFLARRCGIYRELWDEDIGDYQDFGMRVSEYLFGKDADDELKERAGFWIILYTDKVMKDFLKVTNICRRAGLRI